MATSNKDFKIKNGLVVQGPTATVNGNDILTSASSIDDLNDVNVSSKADGYSLVYNASTAKWVASQVSGGSGGGASVTVSDTPPSSPSANSLWFDSSSGAMYVYYNDGDTSQWVAIKAATTVPDASRIFQSDTAPSSQNVTVNDFWFNTITGNLYIWYISGGTGQWVSVQTDVTVAISGDLNTLSDVVTTTPSNNQALVYDSASSKWMNKQISESMIPNLENLNGTLDIASGGTGATTVTGARTSLGIGLVPIIPTSATVSSGSASINSNGIVSFVNAGTMQVNGIFSSDYDFYKIICMSYGKSANSSLRFTTNGVPNSATTYSWTMFVTRSGATSNAYGGASASAVTDFMYSSDTNTSITSMEVYGPTNTAMRTMIQYQQSGPGFESRFGAADFTTTSTVFDGFQIYPYSGSGTYTGKIAIYGYKQ